MASSNPDPTPGTSSTSTPPPVPVAVSALTILNEPSLTPSPFHGNGTENAQDWLDYFKRYVAFKQLNANASLALFALLIRGTVNTWYSSLSNTDRVNYDGVLERFEKKYAPAPISLWRRASELWSRDEKSGETVEEYYSDMVRRAREVSASDEMTRFAMVRGLRPELRTYVMQQNPATNDELLAAAKVSEATVIESSPTITTEILDAIRRLEACAATSIRESCRSPVRSSSPSLRPRSASTSRPERTTLRRRPSWVPSRPRDQRRHVQRPPWTTVRGPGLLYYATDAAISTPPRSARPQAIRIATHRPASSTR